MPEPASAAVRALGQQLGLHTDDARPLRLHDASTLLLPRHHLVVRLSSASEETSARALTALRLTAWLSAQTFPTVRPAITHPIRVAGYVATLWHEIPPQPPPEATQANTALGHMLRHLHTLPTPPIPLPPADPLARLRAALDLDTHRPDPVLAPIDSTFLRERVDDLQAHYAAMQFPLGIGLIHNDAHPGNLLPDPSNRYRFVLTDWESACIGPREMDIVLVGAPGSRFGDTDNERTAFTTAYGYDIATWPECSILRDIRDLHSLAGHIRAAPHSPAAHAELHNRIASLRNDDRTIRWKAI
jgi:aminoglycoside phosphotransferase (APT) family kinase protein